jgi:hypothetical protein
LGCCQCCCQLLLQDSSISCCFENTLHC